LAETGGRLYRSSRLSRVAEQLGWALRQVAPHAVERDCLRNAVNHFFYSDPDELPTSAPANQLSSEVHSFSRVFTAAFFHALAGTFALQPAHTELELQQVSVDLAKLLTSAIASAPITTSYFSQVGAHLVNAARTQNERYAGVIQGAFVRHGILSVHGATVGAAVPQGVAAAAPLQARTAPLADAELDVSGFGFNVSKIKVQLASEPRLFQVAGAAPSIGQLKTKSAEDSALTFVEDLIRRGRLDPKQHASPHFSAAQLSGFRTHELVQDGGSVTLRRLRVDCGLHTQNRPGHSTRS
jgi:hypothetical protein